MFIHLAGQAPGNFAGLASVSVALRDSSNIHGSLHEATLPEYFPPFPTLPMGYSSLNTALERDGAGVNGRKGRGGERKEKERRELERKEEGKGGEGRGRPLDPTRNSKSNRWQKPVGSNTPTAIFNMPRAPQAFPVLTSTLRPERTSREKGNW